MLLAAQLASHVHRLLYKAVQPSEPEMALDMNPIRNSSPFSRPAIEAEGPMQPSLASSTDSGDNGSNRLIIGTAGENAATGKASGADDNVSATVMDPTKAGKPGGC